MLVLYECSFDWMTQLWSIFNIHYKNLDMAHPSYFDLNVVKPGYIVQGCNITLIFINIDNKIINILILELIIINSSGQ